ncbi:uncharacterized protein B0H64DRAFT_243377 [Chaetomium fimeti]|uniref:Uncharacterized protein n=1 Tax=Chaetomium fimeti TaxID=1854472 RepID=A0AAE0H8R8_9PEZI|nr:hypothetical protein B0H64DRAFT_243377 [Chaetomium fimeti]
MSAQITVTLFEEDENFAKLVVQHLLPEYDVVQVCHNRRNVMMEFDLAYGGDLEGNHDIWGCGSNAEREPGERKAPRAIIFRPELTEDFLNAMQNQVFQSKAGGAVVAIPRQLGAHDDMARILRIRQALDEQVANGAFSEPSKPARRCLGTLVM